MSAKRRLQMEVYAWTRMLFLKAHPKCQFPGCSTKAKDIHHLRGRSNNLLLDQRHWKAVCRPHHDWIGAHPKEARALGMLCEKGLWNTPDRT
jgi:hypothetical protein